jgi:hypothetical protein
LHLASQQHWRFVGVVTFATTILVAGMLLGLPWINGPKAWRWVYRSADSLRSEGTYLRLWLPILSGAGFVLYLTQLLRKVKSQPSRKRIVGMLLVGLIAGTAVLAGFACLNPLRLVQIPYAVNDRYITSYYSEAIKITNVQSFLSHYPELIPTFYVHAKTHPPGPILFFWGFNQFFGKAPGATRGMESLLRGTALSLSTITGRTGLSRNQAGALVFSSFLLPILGCTPLIPLYFFGRYLWNHEVGILAVATWIVVPSLILFTPEFDQVYAFASTLSVLFAFVSVEKRRISFTIYSALVAGIGVFFSFAFLVVIFLDLLLFLLCAFRIKEAKPKYHFKAMAVFMLSIMVFFAALFLLTGFNILTTFRCVMVWQAAFAPSYFPWVVYDFYDFFIIGLGVPLFCIFVHYLWRNRDF